MNDSLVSIVIPNYNRANLIGETLDSIIQQTYEDWECIIVDDRSTDGSIEIIKNYSNKDSRFLLIERPQEYSKGANACRNIGKSLAHGKYIIFFDSDDIMLPNHIEEKVRLICSKIMIMPLLKVNILIILKIKILCSIEVYSPLPLQQKILLPKNKLDYFDPIIKTEIAKNRFYRKKSICRGIQFFL
jgi:glycosyltransferase involved in cell wall biosynthesis